MRSQTYPERGDHSLVYWFYLLPRKERVPILICLFRVNCFFQYNFNDEFTTWFWTDIHARLRKAFFFSIVKGYPKQDEVQALIDRRGQVLADFTWDSGDCLIYKGEKVKLISTPIKH